MAHWIEQPSSEADCTVIAEIAQAHDGSLGTAHAMIDAAAEAGVDAVKFQTLRAERIVSKRDVDRFKKLKSFELTFDEFVKLGLVDELGSSDDLLMKAADEADIFKVTYQGKQSLQDKLFSAFENSLGQFSSRLAGLLNQRPFG